MPSDPVRDRPVRSIEAPSRWSGYAYLFRREGTGQGLATGGQLGGSQAGARIAYRLNAHDAPVRLAVAARVAAPLQGRGAEAALGIDVLPIAGSTFRASIERRIGLNRGGRDAWSAYAAGGFYREPSPGLAVDGYAQAGFVGVSSSDPFADGALRIAARSGALAIGGGLWGAAQPGTARIDIGPRAAATVPVAGHTLTAAAEWRMRVAGNAQPGSGAAFTLAVDF